jgi:cytochrome c5
MSQKLYSAIPTIPGKPYRLATLLMALLLVASAPAQDLPDGPGKDLVMKVCTVCHELTRITSKKRTKEEWSDTVDKMAMRGAMATDEEFEMIVAYLAKNFGKGPSLQRKTDRSPIRMNDR